MKRQPTSIPGMVTSFVNVQKPSSVYESGTDQSWLADVPVFGFVQNHLQLSRVERAGTSVYGRCISGII
jgi:hypothetical protein